MDQSKQNRIERAVTDLQQAIMKAEQTAQSEGCLLMVRQDKDIKRTEISMRSSDPDNSHIICASVEHDMTVPKFRVERGKTMMGACKELMTSAIMSGGGKDAVGFAQAAKTVADTMMALEDAGYNRTR